MTYKPIHVNEEIWRKMLELAIELRYLAADGKLNKPTLAVTISCMLEECAQAEGSDTSVAPISPRQSAVA